MLCDLGGRILSITPEEAKLFDCSVDELKNKTCIFTFFPRQNALQRIEHWVQKNFSLDNTCEIFRSKNGQYFLANCHIKIAKADPETIVMNLRKLPGDVPRQAQTKVTWQTNYQILKTILRTKFVVGTIMPMLFGVLWSCQSISPSALPWDLLLALIIGAIGLHMATNTFNDYFDWQSGTDKINRDYLYSISGGSRAIEFGFISTHAMLCLSMVIFAVASAAGLYIVTQRGPFVLVLGLIGAFGAYFYTAPPIRLASRKGLGELFHIICLGPLMVAGTVYTLTNQARLVDFVVGLPFGLLVTASLWANEIPDAQSDALTGKNNLAVVFNRKNSTRGMLFLLFLAYLVPLALVTVETQYTPLLIAFVNFRLIATAPDLYSQLEQDKSAVTQVCKRNFKIYDTFSLLYLIGALLILII